MEDYIFKWEEFQETLRLNFGKLRSDSDYCDVTLACEDGQQVEAHKVVLSTSSPFFESILKRTKHSHPLIYMRGVKSLELSALLDFLYFGQTSVPRENLEAFLSIADELQVTGLSSGGGLSGGAGVEQNGEERIDKISNAERREEEEGGQNSENMAPLGSHDEVKVEVKDPDSLFVNDVARSTKKVAESEADVQCSELEKMTKELGLTGLTLEPMSSSTKNNIESESGRVSKDKVRKRYKAQKKDSAGAMKMNYPFIAEMRNDPAASENITSMMGPSNIKVRGKMAHMCKVCGKEDRISNIKAHIRIHHTMFSKRKDLMTCKLCSAICSKDKIASHIMFVHKDI